MPERGQGRDFFVRSEIGHLDLPRAREGGIVGGFAAVFIPRDPSKEGIDMEMLPVEKGYRVKLADPLEYDYSYRTANAIVAISTGWNASHRGNSK